MNEIWNALWFINLAYMFVGMLTTTTLIATAIYCLGESTAGLKLVYGIIGFICGTGCTLIAVAVML